MLTQYVRYDICNTLSKTFYNKSDELHVFTLNQKVIFPKQKGRILSVYYEELIEIFQELNYERSKQSQISLQVY